MYARVQQVMAQFVLKIEKLSHMMGQPEYQKWCALTVSVPDYGSSFNLICSLYGQSFPIRKARHRQDGRVLSAFVTKLAAMVDLLPLCPSIDD